MSTSTLDNLKRDYAMSGEIEVPITPEGIISSKLYFVTVTPELARAILNETSEYKNQRESKEATVEKYANDMKSGYWFSTEAIPICKDVSTGIWGTLNGKQRLNGVISSNTSIIFPIHEIIVEDTVTMDDLYANCDSLRTRKIVDQARCYKIHDDIGINDSRLNSVLRASRFICTGFRTNSKYIADTKRDVECAKLFKNEIEIYYSICKRISNQKSFLRKGHILSACIAILRKNKRLGSEFLKGVIRMVNLVEGDPRLMLNGYLTDSNKETRKTDIELQNCVFNAWNDWIAGESWTRKIAKYFARPDEIYRVDLEALEKEANDYYRTKVDNRINFKISPNVREKVLRLSNKRKSRKLKTLKQTPSLV